MAFMIMPFDALAAAGHALPAGVHTLPQDLSIIWVVPFACLLLCIAVCPLVKPHFWHHHYGKVAVFWALAFAVPFAVTYGTWTAVYHVMHTVMLEYVPFILLLFALFTVAGGIRLRGSLVGCPSVNTAILAIGTCLASIMGTTGAAMLLIRPLLRANAHRKHKVHQVIFFIFLVANIGGSLTPLGDPPLFLGFLKGVSFFWTTEHLFTMAAIASGVLLVLFFLLDSALFLKEGRPKPPQSEGQAEKLGFDGKINFIFLLGVLGSVLLSGYWKPGVDDFLVVFGTQVPLQSFVRDALLVTFAMLSLGFTPMTADCRVKNGFDWEPILEVAKLFIGIFISMIPAIYILNQGTQGALASVVSLVSNADGTPNNMVYFWITGGLSSVLDNAPTYLVFFNTAGGDAAKLMTEGATTLAAISAGAVFCGAITYIGNAPNFMVKAIAENQKIPMPSFFGYVVWSVIILVPLFAAISYFFFMK